MLKISNKPFNATRDSGMHLSAVPDDDDELIQAINDTADDTIALTNDPDVVAIDTYWSGVQRDLKSDPTWNNFAED